MVSHVKETTILIVDDEHFMLQSLRRLAPQGVRCKVADSVAGAVEMVRSSVALHGLATDVFLPDGTGFEVVEAWVAKYSDAPTMIMTARHDRPEVVNRASTTNSRFLAKPFGPTEFRHFTSDVLAKRWLVPPFVARQFAAFILRHDLSDAQAELLAHYENHVPRRSMAEQMGISENTLKTRVRQLCHKLGVASLDLAHTRMMGAASDPVPDGCARDRLLPSRIARRGAGEAESREQREPTRCE